MNRRLLGMMVVASLMAFAVFCLPAYGSSIVVWGGLYGYPTLEDYFGLHATVPTGNDFVAIAASEYNGLALEADGTLVVWGEWDNDGILSDAPDGSNFTAIAGSGGMHFLALKDDGSVVGWGRSDRGQISCPSTSDFVAIAAGAYHSIGLKTDGSIVGWGEGIHGETVTQEPIEGDPYVAMDAGYGYSLALTESGHIYGWGRIGMGNDPVLTDIPPGGGFSAIAACGHCAAALQSDGTIVEWGRPWEWNMTSAPLGEFINISGGQAHFLAIKTDGSIVAWGDNYWQQRITPSNEGDSFQSIAAGGVQSIALTGSTVVPNTPPVAQAGPDQSVFVGDPVTLDGSGSSDVDGDPLTLIWSLITVPAGSAAVLNDPMAVNPTFEVDLFGTYVVQLIVNDGTVDSAADIVTISTQDSAPVANAGADQTPLVGTTVTLDGSGSSDVDGDPLTFLWSLTIVPVGSAAVLDDPTAVNPTFEVDLFGTYGVQLIVNDGTVDSVPDTVIISTQNSAPVANAGADQTPFVGDTVKLDGSGSSDVDGDPLTLFWSLTTVPVGSAAVLDDPMAVTPTFVVDLFGTYVAQLIVNDGTVDSVPDTVTISTQNSAPVANAGADQTPFVGVTVTLDGSGSSDVDGDPLTYFWSLTTVPAGSAAVLDDPTAVNPTFDVDLFGTYVAQLIVNDGVNDSDPDTIMVQVILGDDDNDGVPNSEDDFPNSDVSPTVIVAGCDTGVVNVLNWDGTGASINDGLSVIEAVDYRNHGAYVSEVTHFAGTLLNAGVITKEAKDLIVSCAARSDIGKKKKTNNGGKKK